MDLRLLDLRDRIWNTLLEILQFFRSTNSWLVFPEMQLGIFQEGCVSELLDYTALYARHAYDVPHGWQCSR